MSEVQADALKAFVERLENLEKDKQEIVGDIGEVLREAKGSGFDTKIIKIILRLRKKRAEELDEEEFLIETYKRALGMAESEE